MKPGDIVLIRFPQADLRTGKLRPALVIAVAPSHHSDLLLALISSQIQQATIGFDDLIEVTDSDFPTTGLKVESVVRIGRLASVEQSVINARLGRIAKTRLESIRQRIIQWLND